MTFADLMKKTKSQIEEYFKSSIGVDLDMRKTKQAMIEEGLSRTPPARPTASAEANRRKLARGEDNTSRRGNRRKRDGAARHAAHQASHGLS
jgi:hypothetical protein